jgi:hypothetical protein
LQYLLCILGIALGVAMLVSIDLASGSAQRAFSLSTDAITGRTTHRLVAIGPGGVPDTTFVELRRQFPEIPAAPVIEAYGRAEELDGELLRLVGVDLFSEAPFRGLLGAGRGGGRGFVPFLTEPGTAVIATETAERFGLHPGAADGSGSLHLDLAGRTSALRLVGSMRDALLRGEILAVFPEGTTGDGRTLLPFHPNLLQAALQADVPVQPIGLRFVDRASGQTTHAPSYIGDETLVGSIWRTLTAPPITAVAHFGMPERAQGRDRRVWGQALHAAVDDLRQR